MMLYRRGPIFWVKWSADGVVIRRSTHTTDRTKAKRFADAIAAAARAPTLEDAIEVLKLIYGERKGGLPLAAAWGEYERLAKTLGKLAIGERTIERRKNILANFALGGFCASASQDHTIYHATHCGGVCGRPSAL